MKPPVDAPTSRQILPARVHAERVERRRELVPAAAHIRLPLDELDLQLEIDEVPGLPVHAGGIPGPGPDLAAEDQRLGAGPRRRQPAIHEELVQALARRPEDRPGHAAIVAQRPSPRLTAGCRWIGHRRASDQPAGAASERPGVA